MPSNDDDDDDDDGYWNLVCSYNIIYNGDTVSDDYKMKDLHNVHTLTQIQIEA